MATFKEVVRKKRADGMYIVYIRVTHNRKIDYIKTDMYVHDGHLNKGEITDQIVKAKCSIRIKEYLDKLNMRDIEGWSVQKVVEYISGGDKVLFYPYCDEFINKLRNGGRDRTADGYENAIKSFKRYFSDDKLTFQDIRQKDLKGWIEKLQGTARAKQKYPTNMKTIFESGRDKYNDYEDNIIVIPNNPFYKLEIPNCNTPQKRAVDVESVRVLLSVEPKGKRAELAQDVAKLIIFLVGINTVDLYDMEDDKIKNGKLCYNRHKTRRTRADKAYTEVSVRPEIVDLFEKYKGENGYLFDFRRRYSSEVDFYKNVNKGLKQLCESAGLEKMTTYSFRHTWATVAKNNCKASDELIGFCLVHSPVHRITWRYIDVDYAPIDELNNEVLDFIFNPKRGEEKKVGLKKERKRERVKEVA